MVAPCRSILCDEIRSLASRHESAPAHGPTLPRRIREAGYVDHLELHHRCPGKTNSRAEALAPPVSRCQFVTGAAQGVDASRVIFAFARDNALPGSRWWKRINRHTQTPVNAVWFVIFWSAVCGLLGFSSAAFSSLAGSVLSPSRLWQDIQYVTDAIWCFNLALGHLLLVCTYRMRRPSFFGLLPGETPFPRDTFRLEDGTYLSASLPCRGSPSSSYSSCSRSLRRRTPKG